MSEHVLDEQRRHYAARAPEYDDWWYRRGRYEVDAETKAAWEADIAEVEQALAAVAHGDVLELAAGTGIWTRKLVRLARSGEEVRRLYDGREFRVVKRYREPSGGTP